MRIEDISEKAPNVHVHESDFWVYRVVVQDGYLNFEIYTHTDGEIETWCGNNPVIYASGSLKWDGCMNYSTGADGCANHACEPQHILDLAKALIGVYELGPLIEGWLT